MGAEVRRKPRRKSPSSPRGVSLALGPSPPLGDPTPERLVPPQPPKAETVLAGDENPEIRWRPPEDKVELGRGSDPKTLEPQVASRTRRKQADPPAGSTAWKSPAKRRVHVNKRRTETHQVWVGVTCSARSRVGYFLRRGLPLPTGHLGCPRLRR